jgi:hypothetical protein
MKHVHFFLLKFFIGRWGVGKCEDCWRWNLVRHESNL